MTTTPLHVRYTDAVEAYTRTREDLSRTPAQRREIARMASEARLHAAEQAHRSGATADASIDPAVFRAALRDFLSPVVDRAIAARIRALTGKLD